MIVTRGAFWLWGACQYLERKLNVDPITFREFKEMIRKDLIGPSPYIFPLPKKPTPPVPPFQPLCHPIGHHSFAVVQSARFIATQTFP